MSRASKTPDNFCLILRGCQTKSCAASARAGVIGKPKAQGGGDRIKSGRVGCTGRLGPVQSGPGSTSVVHTRHALQKVGRERGAADALREREHELEGARCGVKSERGVGLVQYAQSLVDPTHTGMGLQQQVNRHRHYGDPKSLHRTKCRVRDAEPGVDIRGTLCRVATTIKQPVGADATAENGVEMAGRWRHVVIQHARQQSLRLTNVSRGSGNAKQ